MRVDGAELTGLPPERVVEAELALVPEGRRLFADLTVVENLLLGGYHRGRVELAPDLERAFSSPRRREPQPPGSSS